MVRPGGPSLGSARAVAGVREARSSGVDRPWGGWVTCGAFFRGGGCSGAAAWGRMKSFVANAEAIQRKWYLVDAAGQPAGRLAVKIARVLRGRDLPTYTPHVDTGAFVVVVNAEKVRLTGRKEDQKLYKNFSGYPGGLKLRPARVIRQRNPERIIRQAVKGMLPRNKLSRQILKRLKVYAGPEHPHAAQQPQPMEV